MFAMSISKPIVVDDELLLLDDGAELLVVDEVAFELIVGDVSAFGGKQVRFGLKFRRTFDTSAHSTLPFFVNLVTNWSMFIES